MVDFNFYTHSTKSVDETIDYVNNCDTRNLLKLTLFVNIYDNNTFKEFCKKVDVTKKNRQDFLISIVAMPPVDGSFCVFEAIEISNKSNSDISFNHSKTISYCTIKNEECLTLITSSTPNISGNETSLENLYKEAYKSFEEMKNILISVGMFFSDVVRQWSYIEKILDKEEFENGEKQYYQVFNDIRSHFYKDEPFDNGLMSATAVGSLAGIFSTEIIAIRPYNDKIKIVAIKNPNQNEAFNYSDNKLIGTPLELTKKLTTPKFSRAKLVYSNSKQIFFISGTSSVIGEESVSVGNTLGQLEVTLKNIEILLKEQNNINPERLNNASVRLLRVYLKDTAYSLEIKKSCKRKFENAQIVMINSIVCRDNLNIEIEGIATSE